MFIPIAGIILFLIFPELIGLAVLIAAAVYLWPLTLGVLGIMLLWAIWEGM